MSKEAMKLALEALEPFTTPNWAGTGVDKSNEAYAAICEALNTPLAEQKSGIKQVIELYDSPEQPAQQEPVAWVEGEEIYWNNAPDLNDWIRQNGQPLYTSPPSQRTWVGLTDDEMIDLQDRCGISIYKSDFQVIEAKLKERNT